MRPLILHYLISYLSPLYSTFYFKFFGVDGAKRWKDGCGAVVRKLRYIGQVGSVEGLLAHF